MGNNGANTIKGRTTPTKDHGTPSSSPESRKDSSVNSSETSSCTDEIAPIVESSQEKCDIFKDPKLLPETASASDKISTTDTKENVNPKSNGEDISQANVAPKRKKPKSKLITYIFYLFETLA